MATEQVIASLKNIVGDTAVLIDEANRILFSQDVWTKGLTAAAVVQPDSASQLSEIVKTVTSAGFAVIARGGGMSYTKGYTPVEENTFIIDTSKMNKILDINRDDMYVTVEAGCTWKDLHEALKGTGVRTPYWGTLSGIKATVGGSVSQNSVFWGSGRYGTSADSVVSVDVVLADGTILSTGAASHKNGSPFFRHYGPDLTGLFTADCGALGVKSSVTLRLMPELNGRRFLSFNFGSHNDLIETMNEISRQSLAMECFGFDPNLTEIRSRRDSLKSDVKAFTGVLKNSGGIMGAIKTGAKVALAGRGFMKDLEWPMYIMIEERSDASAEESQKAIREIAKQYNAQEVENSIPTIVRANPFGPVNQMLGPGGERWAPIHGLVPLSKGSAMTQAILDLFEENKELMESHGVTTGFLLTSVSTNAFVCEPLFFWPDKAGELHEASVEPSYFAGLHKFDENKDAFEVVSSMRGKIAELFKDMGAVHLQLGKSYPYKESLKLENFDMLESLKQKVDPDGRINPGVLGLG